MMIGDPPMNVKFSPSLMCMDLLNIERGIRVLDADSDYYHVDVIDWHYCKNMSLAPCFAEAIHRISDTPLDMHLYVDNIESDLIQLCIESGAEIITMPPEVVQRQVFRLIRQIKQAGKKVGFFLNPSAQLDLLHPYIDQIDRLLIMTVDPGFAGQPFIESSLEKIREAKESKQANGYTYEIAVDGCCNERYYHDLYKAGAEVFIVGTSGLFGKDSDLKKALEIAKQQIQEATSNLH